MSVCICICEHWDFIFVDGGCCNVCRVGQASRCSWPQVLPWTASQTPIYQRSLASMYLFSSWFCICVFPGFIFVCFEVMYLYFWWQGICVFRGFVFRCALACEGIVMQHLRVLLWDNPSSLRYLENTQSVLLLSWGLIVT